MIDPPARADAAALADWAELWLLVESSESLRRPQIRRRLEAEPDDMPEADDERYGAEIDVAELELMVKEDRRVDLLLNEVRRRQEIAPRVYSFRIDDDEISVATVSGGSAYEFLLWLSVHGTPFRKDDRHDEVEEPYDRLCLAALEVLLGPDADGVLFAERYASDPETDERRPTSFPLAIKWLRGRLRLPAPPGYEPPPAEPPEDDEGDHPARTYSDGGVDVVVWRHFKDARAGFPIVLAQCTVQLEWKPKTTDVVLDLWGDWIRFVTTPHKALLVPFAVPDSASWWRDRSRTAGMILDRMRICELLNKLTDDEFAALAASNHRAWLDAERDGYAAAEAA